MDKLCLSSNVKAKAVSGLPSVDGLSLKPVPNHLPNGKSVNENGKEERGSNSGPAANGGPSTKSKKRREKQKQKALERQLRLGIGKGGEINGAGKKVLVDGCTQTELSLINKQIWVSSEPAKNGDGQVDEKVVKCRHCFKEETEPNTFKRCSRCMEDGFKFIRSYCSKECQIDDWKNHHNLEHRNHAQGKHLSCGCKEYATARDYASSSPSSSSSWDEDESSYYFDTDSSPSSGYRRATPDDMIARLLMMRAGRF